MSIRHSLKSVTRLAIDNHRYPTVLLRSRAVWGLSHRMQTPKEAHRGRMSPPAGDAFGNARLLLHEVGCFVKAKLFCEVNH